MQQDALRDVETLTAGKKLEVVKRTVQRFVMEELEYAVKFILHGDNVGTLSGDRRRSVWTSRIRPPPASDS